MLLEIALAFGAETLSRISSVVESLLGDLFSNRTSALLMQHAASLDLYQFEDPAFYDQLDRARRDDGTHRSAGAAPLDISGHTDTRLAGGRPFCLQSLAFAAAHISSGSRLPGRSALCVA